jgi:ATP-dependent Lon protease
MNLSALPVLPLRDVVVLPNTSVSLYVGRTRSLRAIDVADGNDRIVFLVTQSEPQVQDPEIHHLHSMGTIARIKHLTKMPEGNLKVVVEGLFRAKITSLRDTNGYLSAAVERLLDDDHIATSAERILMRTLLTHYESYLKNSGRPLDELFRSLDSIESPHRLCNVITSQISVKLRDKQKILESVAVPERLEALSLLLLAEIEILKLDRKIRGKVKEQIEKSHRDYYLHEQMAAIQKELGQDNLDPRSEAIELEKKLESKKMPAHAREKAAKEIKRLKAGGHAAEAQMIRAYVDLLLDLPWDEVSEDSKDLLQAERVLNEDHYGIQDAKDRILEFLSVRARVAQHKSPILCLMGPPGVGKTSLARSVARALNRKFEKLSLGGVRDEAELRGHRRTYIGALPGRIISALRKAEVSNPVILLDEIDKMGADFRGDPASALLEILDPEQNKHFSDHYLELEYDLSKVLFICTANFTDSISQPLKDRLEIIQLSGYSEDEKIQIAKNYIIPKVLQNHGLLHTELALADKEIAYIVRRFTREAGVRDLEKQISKICRKIVREESSGLASLSPRAWSEDLIEKYLGAPRFKRSELGPIDDVGVSTGLAWTPVGGEVLRIEAVALPGKGDIQITGQLGSVMQESAKAALSYIRSKAALFEIESDFFSKHDLHIHVPEGATPKDGPSAGTALTVAILSAIKGWKVNRKVGLTGEVSLRGRVLPIGGLKEKLLGAKRAGVETIVYPMDNSRELSEIDPTILKSFKLHPVVDLDEVLLHVFDLPPNLMENFVTPLKSLRKDTAAEISMSH